MPNFSMRLAAPAFFRSDAQSSKITPNLYRVDSEIFETVRLPNRPHVVPSGKSDPIWIKYPDHDASSVFDSSGSFRSTPLSPSLRIQPIIDKTSLAPWVHAPVFDTKSACGTQPSVTSRSLAKTMFIRGFFFPLLWLVGASLLWRNVAPTFESENGAGTSGNEESCTSFLPEAEEKWAWWCIWAFVLMMMATSGILLTLYLTHVI